MEKDPYEDRKNKLGSYIAEKKAFLEIAQKISEWLKSKETELVLNIKGCKEEEIWKIENLLHENYNLTEGTGDMDGHGSERYEYYGIKVLYSRGYDLEKALSSEKPEMQLTKYYEPGEEAEFLSEKHTFLKKSYLEHIVK